MAITKEREERKEYAATSLSINPIFKSNMPPRASSIRAKPEKEEEREVKRKLKETFVSENYESQSLHDRST